jgi:2-hydroxychromene-2-carboxylate isomerase
MPRLDFWYDFASTYSYPAAMRIDAAAEEAGVEVCWRPFLLGPIFKTHGWSDSPFNLLPAKGRYMWRDLERICGALGFPFQRPATFPQQSLTAARVALVAGDEGWGPDFARRVYTAEFAESHDIGEREVITRIIADLGRDPSAVLARAEAPENKLRLRTETEEAQRLGIFGAPSFVTEGGELFWGNDRLEQALAAARD